MPSPITPTIRPTLKQDAAWQYLLDATTRFILFGGGAGGGKTWLYCEWLLVWAYQYPGSRAFIGRNELKRLMNSTFVTWNKVCTHHGIPRDDWSLDGKYNVIRFKNGSTIDLIDVAFKPTDPDYERFGSLEYSHGFGEEVSEWHFQAFDVLKSRIGRHKIVVANVDITPHPKFGLSCNPSKGWVYRVFYKPFKDGTLPAGYAFVPSLYSDNSYLSDDYGKQLSEIADRAQRERLMLGNWDYADDAGTLMKYDHLRDMFSNTIVKDGEKYMIVDVARFGRDKTVFNFFDGLESYRREKYSGIATNRVEQLIKDFAASERIPFSHILVDEDGVGGGVVDHLPGIKGFVAASVPVPTRSMIRRQVLPLQNRTLDGQQQVANFLNLKAQCVFKLAETVETHKIAAKPGSDQDEIIEDLSAMKQKDFDKDGKLKVVGKDEQREALGRSPDIGDTFVMRMLFELLRDASGAQPGRKPTMHSMGMRKVEQRGI